MISNTMYFTHFFKTVQYYPELIRRRGKNLNLMCGNTRPKLLEISYGKTSQQKGEVSYGKTSQQRTLHIPREMPHTLLTYIPPLPLPQTAKTETYEDKDRRSLRWNKAAVPYQLTTTQEGRRRWQTKTDEDGDRRRQLDAL